MAKAFDVPIELKDRALAETAEGITITDARLPDNPLIYANAGFERLTGYAVQDVLGRNCRFLQGPDTDPATLDRLRAAIREQRPITVQLLNYRQDGSSFWNRLSITPVRNEQGEVTHFIGVQSDVSDLLESQSRLETANRRMSADLAAAAKVQRAMLPVEMPESPCAEFSWTFRPCTELAGDILNVFRLDQRRIGMFILDVSGHGVAAALLSVTLSRLLSPSSGRSLLFAQDGHRIESPAGVVARLNREFRMDERTRQYFTIFYAILDEETREFRYVAGGHAGPIWMRPGSSPDLHEATGPPVGLLPAAPYREHVLLLEPGHRLYLYTDGLIEAEDPNGEEFGRLRLRRAIEDAASLPLAESLESVLSAVDFWCQRSDADDDISMLALEIRA